MGPEPATNAPLTPYEVEREERIRRNRERMEALGIPSAVKQLALQQTGMRVVKTAKSARQKSKGAEAQRYSPRLAGTKPVYTGITDDEPISPRSPSSPQEEQAQELGQVSLSAEEQARIDEHDKRWAEFVKLRRCDSPSRGSIYDSIAGVTCHFCRQKKLCGEPDCARCSSRDPSLTCVGKSECTRCESASGRFCRACLLVRYGWELEVVRREMAAGTWLCPHCYAEEHPNEGWICNSSICMKRQGLQPTGIAIFDAQRKGYASVAHYLQAKLRRSRLASST